VLDKAISYAQTRKAQTDAIQQQRNELQVLNWVIRHEIRNDAAIILGWANELMPDSASERRSLNRIEDASDHIVKLTKSVGGLVNTLEDDKAELNAIEMTSVLEAEATRLQETHDSVTITVADGSPESVSVRANEFLGTVFRNVLSSAIERNAADGQHIEISVQPPTRTESESTIDPVSTDGGDSDTYVWVSVKDDGEVIDHLTSESLTTTLDTREADETHIGLYFVNRFMTQYGGEVRLEDDAPDGKIIRLGFVPA
jgi:Signal transduction histidine kinase